jgi:hypothetical protein
MEPTLVYFTVSFGSLQNRSPADGVWVSLEARFKGSDLITAFGRGLGNFLFSQQCWIFGRPGEVVGKI